MRTVRVDAYRAFDRREPGWIKVAIALASEEERSERGRKPMSAAA